MRLRMNDGFTLIELVVVIVILGILAVTVAPKFLDLSSDARIASLKSARGSIKSALELFNSKTIVLGINKQSVPLTLNGVKYWNHWGYPHVKNSPGDRPGIIDLSGIEEDDYELIYEDVISHSGTDRVKVTLKGVQDTSTCFVSVLQAVDADTPGWDRAFQINNTI